MPSETTPALRYRHVDVFAPAPLSGNGLAVFPDATGLGAALMLRLTQELRQFESVFLTAADEPGVFGARVFTAEEELPFAGHPALGAAAVLHEARAPDGDAASFVLAFPVGRVRLDSARVGRGAYHVAMDQGRPAFRRTLGEAERVPFLGALGLGPADLAPGLPLEVVSTGLPYLIVPVTPDGLARAQIRSADFEALLEAAGARFVYVLDVAGREGRTWDNAGRVEDVATGSAAGPAGAYLVRHGLARAGEPFTVRQGRFVGRPSAMRVTVTGPVAAPSAVSVAGDVRMVATGTVDGLDLTLSE